MENEVNVSTNVKNWIIVIGVAVLTFIIVFFFYYSFFYAINYSYNLVL